jgi:D-3-phosphoglycerate dehydrogenase
MHRILISDELEASGVERLRQAGAEVVELEDRKRLPEVIADFDALIVRSSTQVTADLLERGTRLKVVGRAGIGVDNVDVAKATERGILVVNAPTANLLSATEHTFALLLALARMVPAADAVLKKE